MESLGLIWAKPLIANKATTAAAAVAAVAARWLGNMLNKWCKKTGLFLLFSMILSFAYIAADAAAPDPGNETKFLSNNSKQWCRYNAHIRIYLQPDTELAVKS